MTCRVAVRLQMLYSSWWRVETASHECDAHLKSSIISSFSRIAVPWIHIALQYSQYSVWPFISTVFWKKKNYAPSHILFFFTHHSAVVRNTAACQKKIPQFFTNMSFDFGRDLLWTARLAAWANSIKKVGHWRRMVHLSRQTRCFGWVGLGDGWWFFAQPKLRSSWLVYFHCLHPSLTRTVSQLVKPWCLLIGQTSASAEVNTWTKTVKG